MTVVTSKYRGSKEYHIILCKLINGARTRTDVSYKDVAAVLGIHTPGNHMSREVGHVLGEMAEDEHNQGRPLITVIAVGFNGGPGEGFFTLARQLGMLQGSDAKDETAFWKAELQKTHDTWKENG